MRLQQDSYQKSKNSIHAVQLVVIFLAWILTIAVFTQTGSTDGRTGWYFGLCWLSIPIIIYLVMVPMWSRAQRFANVYAFAVLDVFLTILWLSAWAAVASYVSAGKGKGTNTTASGCDNFGYGNASKCKLSEAAIVFGVLLMLLFGGTSYISCRTAIDFGRTGIMPSDSKIKDFNAQTQEAFSSNLPNDELEFGEDFDSRQREQAFYGRSENEEDDRYILLHQADHDDIGQRPMTGLGVSLPYGSTPHVGDYDIGHETTYDRDAFQ